MAVASYILPRFRAFDDFGRPMVGAKLYTYQNKTTTPAPTYQDAQQSAANTNPIVLDASGEAIVYVLKDQIYTFVLKDKADVSVWSQDDVTGAASPQDIAEVDQKLRADLANTDDEALGGGMIGFAYEQDYPKWSLAGIIMAPVNVKALPYGAIGEGEDSKEGDRIAVQRAVYWASENGYRVTLPGGTWDIDNLDMPNNSWLEMSPLAWIKPSDHSAPGAIISNVTQTDKTRRNITLVNPQVDGSLLDFTGLGQDNAIGFATGVSILRIYGGHLKNFIANLARGPGGKGIGVEEGVEDMIADGTIMENITYPTFVSPTLGDPLKYMRRLKFVNLIMDRCACIGWALTDWGTETLPTSDPRMFEALWLGIQASRIGHFPDWVRTTGRIQKTGIFVAHGASNITVQAKVWNPPGYPSASETAGGTNFPNGYPAVGENYIGAGLSGPVGAVFQGWGRNLNIDIEYIGDADNVLDYSFPRPHLTQAFASSIKPVGAYDNKFKFTVRGNVQHLMRSGYVQNSGTLAAGGASSVTLAAAASSNDGEYAGQNLTLTGGTGSGQTRRIIQYIGASRVAVVDSPFSPVPDGTTTYTATGSTTAVDDNQINGVVEFITDVPAAGLVDPSMRFPTSLKVNALSPDGVLIEGSPADIYARANSFSGGSTTRSGTWTPTLFNGTNVTASTAFICNFSREDNVVYFSGRVDINPTASGTSASLQISLPVPATISSSTQVGGVSSDVRGDSGVIFGDNATQRMALQFLPTATGNRLFTFSGSYRL